MGGEEGRWTRVCGCVTGSPALLSKVVCGRRGAGFCGPLLKTTSTTKIIYKSKQAICFSRSMCVCLGGVGMTKCFVYLLGWLIIIWVGVRKSVRFTILAKRRGGLQLAKLIKHKACIVMLVFCFQ